MKTKSWLWTEEKMGTVHEAEEVWTYMSGFLANESHFFVANKRTENIFKLQLKSQQKKEEYQALQA